MEPPSLGRVSDEGEPEIGWTSERASMGTPPCLWMTSSPAGLTASNPWGGARKANILPLPSRGQAAGKIRPPSRPAVGEPEDRFDRRGIREDPQGPHLAPD